MQLKVDKLLYFAQSTQHHESVTEKLVKLDKKVEMVDRHVKCLTLVDGGTLTL